MRVFVADPSVRRSQLGHNLVSHRIFSSLLGDVPQVYLFGPEAGTDVAGLGGPVVSAFPRGYRHVLRRAERRTGFSLSQGASSLLSWMSGRGGLGTETQFAAKLAQTLRALDAGPQDHFVMLGASTTSVDIALKALRGVDRGDWPVLHVRMFAQRFDDPLPREDAVMRALHAAWSAQPGRVFVDTETVALKRVLEERYGFSGIGTYLLPINLPRAGDAVSHGETDTFTVGFIGPVRRDKGAPRLASILCQLVEMRRAAGAGRRLRFLLQDDGGRHARRVREAVEAMSGPDLSLHALEGEVDDAAFAAALQACDALLLPYDSAAYGLRGSGIVSDAVAFKVPVVMSRGMAMREWIRDGNGLEAQSDREFAEGLLRIEAGADDFAKACGKAAARLTRAHGNNPVIRRVGAHAHP